MRVRILVVDDEPDIRSFLQEALETEGYHVDVAANGDEAVAKAQMQPDLILLDVMMPGRSGYEVCESIRGVVSCPIMFLSARDQEADRVKGLAVGGDDYLIKPFSLKELRARIHAHLRREQRERPRKNQSMIRFGELVIDCKGRTVSFQAERIPFTQREFDIVELLVLHVGHVFSRDQIYEKVWGLEADGDSTTVTEHIKKIRAKLTIINPITQYISTTWGVGYKWDIVNLGSSGL